MPDSCKVPALARGYPIVQHRARSPWQGLSQGGERQLLSWWGKSRQGNAMETSCLVSPTWASCEPG